jgi:hypothetical protein
MVTLHYSMFCISGFIGRRECHSERRHSPRHSRSRGIFLLPCAAKRFLALLGMTLHTIYERGLFYVLHFFYELHSCAKSLNEAHNLARSHNNEPGLFTLYQRSNEYSKEPIP